MNSGEAIGVLFGGGADDAGDDGMNSCGTSVLNKRDWFVSSIPHKEAANFIKEHHYS